MTVYVDNMKMRAQLFRWNGVWSNLWADTTEELIDFAGELGLSRMSMVDEGFTTERYVITEKKRMAALEKGAVAIKYGGVEMMRVIRGKTGDEDFKEKGL